MDSPHCLQVLIQYIERICTLHLAVDIFLISPHSRHRIQGNVRCRRHCRDKSEITFIFINAERIVKCSVHLRLCCPFKSPVIIRNFSYRGLCHIRITAVRTHFRYIDIVRAHIAESGTSEHRLAVCPLPGICNREGRNHCIFPSHPVIRHIDIRCINHLPPDRRNIGGNILSVCLGIRIEIAHQIHVSVLHPHRVIVTALGNSSQQPGILRRAHIIYIRTGKFSVSAALILIRFPVGIPVL